MNMKKLVFGLCILLFALAGCKKESTNQQIASISKNQKDLKASYQNVYVNGTLYNLQLNPKLDSIPRDSTFDSPNLPLYVIALKKSLTSLRHMSKH